MSNQQNNEALRDLSSEKLMELCLQKIFDDISHSETKGQVELRDAALRAKALAEMTLIEVRLRKVGLSTLKDED